MLMKEMEDIIGMVIVTGMVIITGIKGMMIGTRQKICVLYKSCFIRLNG